MGKLIYCERNCYTITAHCKSHMDYPETEPASERQDAAIELPHL